MMEFGYVNFGCFLLVGRWTIGISSFLWVLTKHFRIRVLENADTTNKKKKTRCFLYENVPYELCVAKKFV
jgi:hypothetical protein